MLIDPFRLCVALGPLAVYFMLLGIVNLSRRPLMISGTRDMVALAVASAGMMVVGPMELFMPQAAVIRFAGYVWLLLLAFYGLAVSLAMLLTRPRLVIYNITIDELRPILAELAPTLDPDARWAGESLALPQLGVHLYLDSFPALRNVSLVAGSREQSFDGWQRLQAALADALRQARVPINPRGISLLTLGLLMSLACVTYSLRDPQALAQGLREMLRL